MPPRSKPSGPVKTKNKIASNDLKKESDNEVDNHSKRDDTESKQAKGDTTPTEGEGNIHKKKIKKNVDSRDAQT